MKIGSEEIRSWKGRLQAILPLDPSWKQKARQRLLEQTRPEGSLGKLESYLERLVAIQKREKPSVARKRIVLFAADHGVEAEGVSLYPREVTRSMVYNFLSGKATINAFARAVGVEVRVVDMGVDHEFGPEPGLLSRKVRPGTSNIRETQAMSEQELLQALETGWEIAREAGEDEVELLGVGEMGIANTTAASAVISALTKIPPERVTGRGTGIDDPTLKHKVEVIEQALEVNHAYLQDPFSILESLGGFEIAAIAGCVMGAAHQGIPCVIDGWIAFAGALVPIQLQPLLLDYLFFAHESEEKGHRLLLEELDIHPLLKLSMRLGEGTGACLAMAILEAAVRAYNEVATFDEAQVARKKDA
jgi:nicotinate-nucleotide--dimethylbenzimidazole phosphoribosyltransferase